MYFCLDQRAIRIVRSLLAAVLTPVSACDWAWGTAEVDLPALELELRPGKHVEEIVRTFKGSDHLEARCAQYT